MHMAAREIPGWTACSCHLALYSGERFKILVCVIMVQLTALASLAADEGLQHPDLAAYKEKVRPFLQQHCVRCHDAETTKGGVRFDSIDPDLLHGEQADIWLDSLHRLEDGDMPPKKEPRPDAAQQATVMAWIRRELRKAEVAKHGVPGRVVIRRLSRLEYGLTMRDLLGLPYDFSRHLSPDTLYEGFDHVASVQELSRSQVQQYLELALRAVNLAIPTGPRPAELQAEMEPEDPASSRWRIIAHGHAQAVSRLGVKSAEWHLMPNDKKSGGGPIFRGTKPPVRKKDKDGKKITASVPGVSIDEHGVWLASAEQTYAGSGSISYVLPYAKQRMFTEGLIKLRIRAGTKRTAPLQPWPVMTVTIGDRLLAQRTVTAPAEQPEWYEFTFHLADVPRNIHQRYGYLGRGFEIRNDTHLAGQRAKGTGYRGVAKWNPPVGVDMPRLYIDRIEWLANGTESWPPHSQHVLLAPGEGAESDRERAKRILQAFASRAFRRPVGEAELKPFLGLFDRSLNQRASFIPAVKEALAAILVSPRFLFLLEGTSEADRQRRPLDAYELASRLSYFLWSRMPDKQLLARAADGSLLKANVLATEVQRHLAHAHADVFYEQFTRQWLRLDVLEDLMFDDIRWNARPDFRHAVTSQPMALWREVVRKDECIDRLIANDYIMIDDHLSLLYGFERVAAADHIRMPIPQNKQHRGGLLSQAAVMALTTDGMETSPIYRGVWMLEKILGRHRPEPPADVPPLEEAIVDQDKRLDLREQLALHNSKPECAACHARIDPLGWPFQVYGLMGEFHSEIRGSEGKKSNKKKAKKRPKRRREPQTKSEQSSSAAQASASRVSAWQGALPNGTVVRSVQEFKHQLLVHHKADFYRSLTRHLMIYALGRPLDISDDVGVDTIVTGLLEGDASAQDLIQAIVLSKAFREK